MRVSAGMTLPDSSPALPDLEADRPIAEPVASVLRRAPRHLDPHIAAQIGALIGPLNAGTHDTDRQQQEDSA